MAVQVISMSNTYLRTFKRRRGFTLVELIVAITAGAIVSGSAAMLLLNASRFRAETAARAEMVDMASVGLETMVRYIREIDQDECPGDPSPCLNGNAQIDTAAESSIVFDTFGFRLNGSNLEMSNDSTVTWQPLVRNVSEFTLTYFDRTNIELSSLPLNASDREDVRRVQIRITLQIANETLPLQTSVYLRAFMGEVLSDP